MMKFSVGPEPTDRQQTQRDETYRAAEVLRAAGFKVEVRDLMCGSAYPRADSAMITITLERA